VPRVETHARRAKTEATAAAEEGRPGLLGMRQTADDAPLPRCDRSRRLPLSANKSSSALIQIFVKRSVALLSTCANRLSAEGHLQIDGRGRVGIVDKHEARPRT